MKHAVLSLALGLALCGCTAEDATEMETESKPPRSYEATGWPAKTLPEITAALQSGEVSAEAVTQAYLDRIEMVDFHGPTLQAILTLNPNAMAEAQALDAKRAAGEALGALHGVPILLKDNIESADDMATTAGSFALKDNVTGRDSPLVAGLRAEGAIILGKTNLSQWANFRSEGSLSGWSSLGGQVRNPHMLDRNPCGSSSGSGAAAAASLAAGTVGTETNGSIICPSNANGVVGFKPTVGLVAQDYIVPISSTQDTAGPITKTVEGAAMMLNAMATGEAKADYVAGLDPEALQGKRIGVARFAEGSNADVITLFHAALTDMEAAGATLVDIDTFQPATEDYYGKAYDVLKFEFKATLNAYLADAAPAVTTRSLEDLIAFNTANADVELALFNQDIFDASQAMDGLDSEAYRTILADVLFSARTAGIDRMLSENDVDFIVSPSGPVVPRVDAINGDVWPSWAGAGGLAAVAGYPHLTVPMGHVHGVPVGVSFIGGKDADAAILSAGYAYEQATLHRKDPEFLATAEERPEIAGAMARK